MPNHRYGVILAGGRGTRFWPKSRRNSAKQVLRLFGERSLIQQTVDRLRGAIDPDCLWVITNEFLQEEIRKQLPEVPKAQIIAEPAQRNTAPCIALAAQILAQVDAEAVMGVFPADHLILKEAQFRKFVKAAFQAAGKEGVVVLGIRPRWAETGYGYIEFSTGVKAGDTKPSRVASFREKPDARTAKKFFERGNFYWNAGMFFWRAEAMLELMRRHQPKTATLLAGLPRYDDRLFPAKLQEVYPLCEGISVDYAILEKAEQVAGLALDDIGWSDVGSWDAVYELASKNKDANASRGELFADSSIRNYVYSDKPVALVGVEDLIVVDSGDALLVAHRNKAQDVSKIVKQLEDRRREELL